MKRIPSKSFLVFFALATCVSAQVNATPSVIYTQTESAGIYQYDFTLNAETGDLLFELFLDIPVASADVLNVVAPPGWGSISDPFAPGFLAWGDNGFGGTFVDSTADFGAELFGPGVLAGFSLTSVSQVSGLILFSVNFDPNLSEAAMVAPVPEPTTLLLVISGILAVSFTQMKLKNIHLI